MVPSEMTLTNGIVAFIEHFGWKSTIAIVEEQPVYISVSIFASVGQAVHGGHKNKP